MGSFDVALLEALLSAGVSHERARAVVDLFDRSVDERYSLHAQVLATRRDVAELETRLDAQVLATRRDVAELETRLVKDVAALETRLAKDIAQTQSRIAETKADLVKWTLAALTAQTALLLGAMKLF